MIMVNKQECVEQIQSTINLLHNLEQWERQSLLKAMTHGLQGEKRQDRHESGLDSDIIKYLQSEAFDLFEVEIYPTNSSITFADTNTAVEYLKVYRNGIIDVYTKLHEAANRFVILCLRKLSVPLYKRCECLHEAIVEVNRDIRRYEAIREHGTALHDLMRTNNTLESKHDRFEKIENYIGD
jgi:hypothetical protein